MEINFEQMVASLQKIRRDHGYTDFQTALRGLFRNLITTDSGMQYARRLLDRLGCPDAVDLAQLEAEATKEKPPTPAPSPSGDNPAHVIEAAIHRSVPNCKTQAHFDLILQAWQALTIYLNAAYGFDVEAAKKARAGLESLLDLAPQLAHIHQRIQDEPDATTNRDYVEPPKQVTEASEQAELLAELSSITSKQALDTWYAAARARMDRIVSQKLRNDLFDEIRRKRNAFAN